ncbi:ribonuclease III [Syntrophotalea carbinolica DSM 2380]|uniref:Ribonuclease 3 n=1 Tax=Syntrophotalea carbinolica (strain DSM 2380 / NBRC 103641 / GraBd1) TaxID=338963 RepID=RNC_SYNC1|nr:ribonuclease III [Syntrophotalea carbinolica]Q3A4Q8.1 RecName: Full=Ribonuclease 3; AltName: Full=Ribonuclease III; Short=RNase III [Syntrophotalea carbinolica DSM 2380]ABA88649.1 ribonuclease III [Syntrophotalea carbinolica DSM 2380]
MLEAKSAALLEDTIDYVFDNQALLLEALTHKSFSNEQNDRTEPDNERLEFLGDAVLGVVVSHYIFRTFPHLPEGELTRIRSEVVSEKGLTVIGKAICLGDYMRLGKGEERSGGRQKSSLLANTMEALLGAVFCDGGFDSVRRVIEALFIPHIQRAARRKTGVDYKTRLQERLQARFGDVPQYVLIHADGPPHQRSYSVEAHFRGSCIGQGQGRSKKSAEQAAAKQALEYLEE